ncbi:MAG: hypothetical protein V1745_04505 [Patescibacteria group bacterium]
MHYLLYGFVGLVSYFLIGRVIGTVSWWTWHQEWTKSWVANFLARFLFPFRLMEYDGMAFNERQAAFKASEDEYQNNLPLHVALCEEQRETYLAAVALLWPFKFVINAIPMAITLLYGLAVIFTRGFRPASRRPTKPEHGADVVEAKFRALETLKAEHQRDEERIRILEAEIEVEEILTPPTDDEAIDRHDEKRVH